MRSPRSLHAPAALLCGAALLLGAACRPAAESRPPAPIVEVTTTPDAPPAIVDRSLYGPPIAAITGPPEARIRVVVGASTLTLSSAAALRIRGADGIEAALRGPLKIVADGEALAIRDRRGRRTRAVAPLEVRVDDPATLSVDGRAYPGSLVLRVRGGSIDAINHVDLERYLPGVLARELFPGWEPAAYQAQAIAARSYALWEIARARDRGRDHDLEATTASQAYGGIVDHARAIEAVAATRGQVLVYDDHVVPAFYSSAHGRAAQDGIVAFPGVAPDIAPLRGGARGAWEAESPHGSWGPIVHERAVLAQRLAAWGRSRGDPIAELTAIAGVSVSRRSAAGRPAEFTIVDGEGRRFTLAPESFRHACNFDAPGLPRAPRLKSSDVEVEVAASTVTMQNGSGFGHGVGLSQWGAHGMAAAGRAAAEILAIYYPEAEVLTLYP
ncbi:MAG: SpoIID/LytB domain-containing protein [Nannocystaceae bacterium]